VPAYLDDVFSITVRAWSLGLGIGIRCRSRFLLNAWEYAGSVDAEKLLTI